MDRESAPRLGPRSDRALLRVVAAPTRIDRRRVWVARAEWLVRHHGRRVCSYGVVGVTGVALGTILLYLLGGRGGLNHIVAAGIASEISILTNFALNDVWTFRDRRGRGSWLGRAAQYNGVALIGMVIQLAVLAALTLGFGIHYLIANLVGIGFATLSNYVLNSRFTWGKAKAGPSRPSHLRIIADAQ